MNSSNLNLNQKGEKAKNVIERLNMPYFVTISFSVIEKFPLMQFESRFVSFKS